MSFENTPAAEIAVYRDGAFVWQHPLNKGYLTIGTAPSSDLVLYVKNTIALIVEKEDDGYALSIHRGPTHKAAPSSQDGQAVLISGRPLKRRARLHPEDRVVIENYELELYLTEPLKRSTQILDTEDGEAEESSTESAFIRVGKKRYQFDRDQAVSFGSHEDNDVVLDDPFVSTFHAELFFAKGNWVIKDKASTNGTRMAGTRIQELTLTTQGPYRFTMGSTEVTFEVFDAEGQEVLPGIFGSTKVVHTLAANVRYAANSDKPVLIIGPTGTGKELIAKAVHKISDRRGARFVPLNTGAVGTDLIEAELFGYEKGAFTGANTTKPGLFESAKGGTIFLDEIGELSPAAQVKLLRVLETGCIRRVGGVEEIPVNARIVSATHRNLKRMVKTGEFRKDLYHRLNVIPIKVPALCQRAEDVPLLARWFLHTQASRPITLTDAAEARLMEYHWPGNVRELKNVLERTVVFAQKDVIDADDFYFDDEDDGQEHPLNVFKDHNPERDRLICLLKKNKGNASAAAREDKVSKTTFHDQLKRLGIDPKIYRRVAR